jgi:hypothetical protein
MKTLAYFINVRDLLAQVTTPEEAASVLEAITECETLFANIKQLAAQASQSSSAPAPGGAAAGHHTPAAHLGAGSTVKK